MYSPGGKDRRSSEEEKGVCLEGGDRKSRIKCWMGGHETSRAGKCICRVRDEQARLTDGAVAHHDALDVLHYGCAAVEKTRGDSRVSGGPKKRRPPPFPLLVLARDPSPENRFRAAWIGGRALDFYTTWGAGAGSVNRDRDVWALTYEYKVILLPGEGAEFSPSFLELGSVPRLIGGCGDRAGCSQKT